MPKGETRVYRDGAWKRRGRGDILADGFIPYVTKPDANNTGVRPGITRTLYTGGAVISTPGAVFQNMTFDKQISLQAANVSFYNCEFLGPVAPTGDCASIYLTSAATTGAYFEFCTFRAQTPQNNIWQTGLYGGGFFAYRCQFKELIDCIGLNRPGARLECCFAWSLTYFTPCSYQPDNQTHNDVVQFHPGVSNPVLRGNRWQAKYNALGSHQPNHRLSTGPVGVAPACAVFMFGGNLGSNYTVGLDCQDDWFEGGYQPVNGGGPAVLNIGKIWRGKFDGDSLNGPNTTGTSRTIDLSPDTVCDAGEGTANQNVYEATGTPVTVRRNQ